MRMLIIKPRAIRDLMDIADYFAARNPKIADKFEINFKKTTARLALYPRTGSPVRTTIQGVNSLRRCTIDGFPNWSLFYAVGERHIDIVRVFHGARNISRQLRKRS